MDTYCWRQWLNVKEQERVPENAQAILDVLDDLGFCVGTHTVVTPKYRFKNVLDVLKYACFKSDLITVAEFWCALEGVHDAINFGETRDEGRDDRRMRRNLIL